MALKCVHHPLMHVLECYVVQCMSAPEYRVSFDCSHFKCMHFIITVCMVSGCNGYRVNLWKSTKNSYSKKSDKILDFDYNDRDMKKIMARAIYIGTEEHYQNLSQDMIPL